jgi:hypothetical protein
LQPDKRNPAGTSCVVQQTGTRQHGACSMLLHFACVSHPARGACSGTVEATSNLHHNHKHTLTCQTLVTILTLPNTLSSPSPSFVPTGSPEPLGPSKQGNTTNFAVYSGGASSMQLVVLNPTDNSRQEIPMNKSGEQSCHGRGG